VIYKNHELKLEECDKKGFFSGYASLFMVEDFQNDIVMPGAFSRSLQQKNPKMLWQHQAIKPIGFWRSIKENRNGLWVEGQLLLELKQGQEAYVLLKEGVVDGLSIGFYVQEATRENRKRLLHHVDLQEISLVTFAAQPQAKVCDIKNQSILSKLKNFANFLENL
jgi:HK97 family phage prohead protease